MQTKIISANELNRYGLSLREVAAALRGGALVVFPTETVYGVAASAHNADAVARLRQIKRRSNTQAFTVHLPDRQDARRYVGSPSPLARRLARKAWPGPLTLVCTVEQPEQEEIAQLTPPQQLKEIFYERRVGLRCPAHAVATELLREAAVPIVASSANEAGKPPPFDLAQALRSLDGVVEYALDGGRTRMNAASTIVEIDGPDWKVRRLGAIDERTVRRMARSQILMVCTGNSCRSPLAEYLFRAKLAARLGISIEQMTAEGYLISSAGTLGMVGAPISDGSREELAKRNIDAGEHRSQPLTIELIQRSERIYTMTPEHKAAVLDLLPSAADRVQALDDDNPVRDPIGGGPEAYHACAEQIEKAVDARLEEFLNEDRNW